MSIDMTVLDDGSGYRVRDSDLQFLQITQEQLADFLKRRRPLGMREDQYDYFVQSLVRALDKDGIHTCDLRLQGSSAHFFAGHHKTMPWDRPTIIEEFRKLRERVPQPIEVDMIQAKLNDVWPSHEPRPRRRPFDVMFRIGIDRDLSDYDIQVSSDEIFQRTMSRIEALGIEVSEHMVVSSSYNFIRKDLVVDTCPFLSEWATLQTDILGRLVAVAAFPAVGPPNREAEIGPLSSHFKDSDWLIAQEGLARDG